MLCNATAFPPPRRLQSVNETRAGSRQRQKAGVSVEGRAEERDGKKEKKESEGEKMRPQDIERLE